MTQLHPTPVQLDLLLQRARSAGRLTTTNARGLVGAACDAALALLVEHGDLIHVPGGGRGRATRAGHYQPVQHGRAPSEAEVRRAQLLLQGQSGTLLRLAGLLGLPREDALAVLLALRERGLARGGPVGATFSFTLPLSAPLPCAPPVTPVARTVGT